MKVALIDKAPNRTKYKEYFSFDFDHYHMSSVPITKLLKKDVDLEVDLEPYDYVILVGAEAAKEYAKITSVTNMAGQLVADKFIAISNPAMLAFKPEGKPDFNALVIVFISTWKAHYAQPQKVTSKVLIVHLKHVNFY